MSHGVGIEKLFKLGNLQTLAPQTYAFTWVKGGVLARQSVGPGLNPAKGII